MAGVGFFDGDDHEIVEDTLRGEVDVDDLGEGELHQGEEDALDELCPSMRLPWGLPLLLWAA